MTEKMPAPDKRMRLRYAGTCRSCATQVAAGEQAIYLKATKQVECISCRDGAVSPTKITAKPIVEQQPAAPTQPEPVDVGVAGASAHREYERRAAGRADRVRAAHPKIGGFLLAITDEPQWTRAWDVGARGEEKLAKRLNALVEHGALVLHDRRIPGTKANIDHITVSCAGVYVIDAKRYHGRPTLKVEGGILRARTETLLVGRRTCTKLLTGITKQVDLVKTALATTPEFAKVPVRGMLCFIDADWPMFGGAFVTGGVDVLWPGKAVEKITTAGPLTTEQTQALHRHLAHSFPVA